MRPGYENTAAVVVTYHPDPGFADRLRAMQAVGRRLFVVDNSSQNNGLAAALNSGFREAQAAGFEWVIAFDQDSEPEPDILAAAGTVSAAAATAGIERIAVIGTNQIDAAGNSHPRGDAAFERRDSVITSGSVHSLAAFREIGGFREDLFIDCVDLEWCHRARRAGWHVLWSPQPSLRHAIGAPTRHNLAGHPIATSNHLPFRRYYMTRNALAIAREQLASDPRFAAGLAWRMTKSLLLMVLFERDRVKKSVMAARGVIDGLRGHLGPGVLAKK